MDMMNFFNNDDLDLDLDLCDEDEVVQINVFNDGNTLFRSITILADEILLNCDRFINDGRPIYDNLVKREELLLEKHINSVSLLLNESIHYCSRPNRLKLQNMFLENFQRAIAEISTFSLPVGRLELIASSFICKRPVVIYNEAKKRLVSYGLDLFPQAQPLNLMVFKDQGIVTYSAVKLIKKVSMRDELTDRSNNKSDNFTQTTDENTGGTEAENKQSKTKKKSSGGQSKKKPKKNEKKTKKRNLKGYSVYQSQRKTVKKKQGRPKSSRKTRKN